ncbi:MAG: Hpt domain-containing protein, partial [Spirochaetaceae bacterium]|nr:Hpt domain-containing protein [Spirochaetaceae bacterium]
IAMTGGKLAAYCQVMETFRKDAQQRLAMLKKIPEADSLLVFITQVHALKSASASLGAADISFQAAELEAAGKAKDLVFIQENLPSFAEHLEELVNRIQLWEISVKEKELSELKSKEKKQENQGDVSFKISLLHELAAALKSKNISEIDSIMQKLGKTSLDTDAKTKESMEKISDHILMAEFDNADKIVRSLLDSITG